MRRAIILDKWFAPEALMVAAVAWPAPDWPGWHDYAREGHAKRAADAQAPLPPALAAVLARMAAIPIGALLGMPESVPDLSLWGGGPHEMPPGAGLGRHLDADGHPRLGLMRAWSAVLYVHPAWQDSWGGELVLEAPHEEIMPRPGRLVAFDCRDRAHHVRPVRCPEGESRRSLALFGYLPRRAEGLRPRAEFAAAG